jgi:hypothetical protein
LESEDREDREIAKHVSPAAAVIPEQEEQGISLWVEEVTRINRTSTSLASEKRKNIFKMLSAGARVISTIDQGQTLWQIYEQVIDIESWWTAELQIGFK